MDKPPRAKVTPSILGMDDVEYIRHVSAKKVPSAADCTAGASYRLPVPFTKRTGESEQDLQRSVLQYLKTLPHCWHLRVEGGGKIAHTGAGMRIIPSSMTGAPDVLVCHVGKLYAMELKVCGGTLSSAQHAHLRQILKAGGKAAVVTSLEGAVKFLNDAPPVALCNKQIPVY